MKHGILILFSAILLSYSASAESVNFTAQLQCKYSASYAYSGWKVHQPDNFDEHNDLVVQMVRDGQDNGSVIYDMSGPIVTKQTVDKQPLRLDATSWDNLNTNRDLMYGDYAILVVADGSNEIAEVRWFDGKQRHISMNSKYLTCMSEAAPDVENSIL